MGTPDLLSVSGLLVLFFLGLRHGLDPDHVATVDSLTFGVMARNPRVAPWIGSLFALGHGGVVAAIAIAAGLMGKQLQLGGPALALAEWSPVLLLAVVGTMNLQALWKTQGDFRPVGIKTQFLPGFLRDSTHPMAIFLVGVVFALVLDTAAQAASWGYAAATRGGVAGAAGVGLVFTLGMLATATAYGQIMSRVLAKAGAGPDAGRFRRMIGWATVVLAYGVVLYAVVSALFPGLALGDTSFALVGLAAVAMLALSYPLMKWRARQRAALVACGAGAPEVPAMVPLVRALPQRPVGSGRLPR